MGSILTGYQTRAWPRGRLFCCDTYKHGARGQLRPGEHHEMKTADEVVRCEVLVGAAKAVGAMTYEIDVDHEFEDDSEPLVLVRLGENPEQYRQS